MILDFNKIPEQAKTWVFASSRKFYPQEILELQKSIVHFLSEWQNLDKPINCTYLLKYDRFIIITADDADKSLSLESHNLLTSFIQKLEKKHEVLLLDKINVCYKQGDFVQYKDLKAFKKMIKDKSVSQKTVVFNNLINTKEELAYDWEINIMDSWLGRFIKK